MPDARTFLHCFLRTYLVGATFNTRGMQNVGLVYAMEPGLRAIFPDPTARRNARKRYLRHYNTHPFWTPLLVGVFLALEMRIARGDFPPKLLSGVKDTTVYTLSAIGDSVFGGSLLVFWSLSTCTLVAAGHTLAAFWWSFALFVLLQLFKLFTFAAGLREGLTVLQRLKQWDLINWGERVKLLNGGVLASLLWIVWPDPAHGVRWAAGVLLLTLLALCINRYHVSRMLLAALAILGTMALTVASGWLP